MASSPARAAGLSSVLPIVLAAQGDPFAGPFDVVLYAIHLYVIIVVAADFTVFFVGGDFQRQLNVFQFQPLQPCFHLDA